MKKTLILTLALAAGLTSARASNISIIDFGSLTPGGPVLSNPVTYADGSSLPNGGIRVRLGYFNTAAQTATWLSDLQSNDVARINSALISFIPLGENAQRANLGLVPTTTGPRTLQRNVNQVSSPGRLAGGINEVVSVAGTPNTENASGVPAGSRIFLLVYSDADATLGATEQFGVFSADSWLMPSDSGLHPVLNTIDVDTAGEVFRGRFGSLQMALIPEPAATGLALLAGLGMLVRRRR
jgi:hypothetical protein